MGRRRRKQVEPDYYNLFAPPENPVPVECRICGARYPSNKMTWDRDGQMWVCRDWPMCPGEGFGCDIRGIAEDGELPPCSP